uniref:Integral membrane protein-like protein n=1 Tax=Solibacter usitatus (strain Ellin6076) TaxID=234267 RepID=Q01NM5_SOLUE
MLFFALTISLSAFLLFEVQPVIAKMILPWFGGSSAVWSTCMLFFQMVLLLGYLYAHLLHRMAPRRQAIVHIGLLAAGILALPIIPNAAWKHSGLGHPSLTILALLAVTVGMPYFLLASTSPLLQAWYSRNHKGGMPYRLFALSNAASLLALLTYPALIEPNLPSRIQGLIWSGAFVCFAILCSWTAWRTSTERPVALADAIGGETGFAAPPSWTSRLLWLGLSGSASILLLAVTTHLTQDVAAIPFLWIIPLVVYLLSFIICFESPRLYHRALFVPLLIVSLAFMAYRLWPEHGKMDLRLVIALLSAGLFVCCMVCHGELVRLKPHPRYLTGFYVTISCGGAAGGLFVGLLAPNVFHAYYEFPIGLALCALIAAIVFTRELWHAPHMWRSTGIVVLVVLLGGYFIFLRQIMFQMVDGYLVVSRNFYGQLRVEDTGDPRLDDDASRKLIHGIINHGQQMLRAEYRRNPVTYFCPQSGIGRGMTAQEGRPRRIGILGLGCGTLAAYGRAGDTLRIYEINPEVLKIANRDFTYLKDTEARVEVAMGDGRLVLESEPPQQFDMLVMDAFSGDSVPVHLITKEAFAIYFRHLKPDGILAVNISNTYLNLEPVMERAANAFHKLGLVYHWEPPADDPMCFSCSWTLIMDPATADKHPELLKGAIVLHPKRPFRIWTDEFSNMFSILK